MTTTRQKLIRRAVSKLSQWNWKHFKQEQGIFDEEDKLPDSHIEMTIKLVGHAPPCLYVLYDQSNAHVAVEGAMRHISGATKYYMALSTVGFTRLVNEVERKAQKELDYRVDLFNFFRDKNKETFARVCALGTSKTHNKKGAQRNDT